MKYDLKAFLNDDPAPYEVFNLDWVGLTLELDNLKQRQQESNYKDVHGVNITPIEEA